jgi:hypothetical protein
MFAVHYAMQLLWSLLLVFSLLFVSNLEHLHVEYLSEFIIKCVLGSLI